MTEAQSFLAEIERFLVRTGMSPASFSKRAYNDGKFVDRLRGGGQVTLETAERIRMFMRDYRSEARKRRVA